ncbi:MAG: hypothetical protein H0T75_21320 [Rhizobiales bacterium]|nr:hypothetical protein [Hyphomicrobiales bacterium]
MTAIPEAIASRIMPLDRTLSTLETPAVLVDIDVAERNLQRWQDRCAQAGLRDRPHIKTHRNRHVGWYWFRALRRRSQTTRLTWARMKRLTDLWLPPARVRHPLPDVRFRVITQGRSPVR